MTVEDIARICHEANRVYCESIGDTSQPHWEDAPDWQKQSAVAGVNAYLEASSSNSRTTEELCEQSHIGWLEMKLRDGWTYGPVKDADRKVHPCMLPYKSLPREQKKKDHIFTAICRALFI
jgi:hypothetical protein